MYKADKGIVITNNTFTQAAIELAKANNIELVDGGKIEEYKKQILSKIQEKNMEIDRNRLRLDLENYFGTAQILMSSRQITSCR